jgi:tetratricopeptide (TPR) repeat protein
MSELLANPKICGACNRPGCDLKCACKLVFYCGEECQRAHWPTHKKDCRLAHAKKVKDAKREHGRDNFSVATARMQAGIAHQQQGRFRQAEQCYLEAHRVFTSLSREGNSISGHTVESILGHTCGVLGMLYKDMGRFDEAISMLKESIQIQRSTTGESSQQVGVALQSMGDLLYTQGKHEEALATLEEALVILTETAGKESDLVAAVLTEKGNSLVAMNRQDEARAMHEEALRIFRIAYGDDSSEVATSLNNLGNILFDTGMLVEARDNFEEALGIMRRVHGERHPSVAALFHGIATVLSRQGQFDEALKMFKKALKIKRKVLGEDHVDVAMGLDAMGNLLGRQGRYDEALEMYEKALAIYTRALGIDSRNSAVVHFNMAMAKEASGDPSSALESARESERIFKMHGANDQYSQKVAGLVRRLEA